MKNIKKILAAIDKLEDNGPTIQLWLQYFKLTYLLQRYIDAERYENFELYLETVQLIIPFFPFRS